MMSDFSEGMTSSVSRVLRVAVLALGTCAAAVADEPVAHPPAKADDGYIVFWRHRVLGPKDTGEAHLAKVRPDGTALEQITKGWESAARPDSGWFAISPDGEQIAYADWGGQTLRIKSLRDDKPGSALNVKGDMWHWSADGKEILIAREDEAGREFKHEVVSVNTNEVRPVRLPVVERASGTKHRAGHFVTDWSNDGVWYLTTFISGADPLESSIYLVKRDGSMVKPLLGTTRGAFGRFSPDGKHVLFKRTPKEAQSAKYKTVHLNLVSVADGEPLAIEEHADRQVMEYTWSPDGRRIAYTYRDLPKSGQPDGLTKSYLVVANADGKNSRTLLSETGYQPQISDTYCGGLALTA